MENDAVSSRIKVQGTRWVQCWRGLYRWHLYLVAIMHWNTRKMLSLRVTDTLDPEFCVDALENTLTRYGRPEILNTRPGRAAHLTGVYRRAQSA
jgi:hypothetical protein